MTADQCHCHTELITTKSQGQQMKSKLGCDTNISRTTNAESNECSGMVRAASLALNTTMISGFIKKNYYAYVRKCFQNYFAELHKL